MRSAGGSFQLPAELEEFSKMVLQAAKVEFWRIFGKTTSWNQGSTNLTEGEANNCGWDVVIADMLNFMGSAIIRELPPF